MKDNASRINDGDIEVECFYSITRITSSFLTIYFILVIPSCRHLLVFDKLNIIRYSILSSSRENGRVIRCPKCRYNALIHRNIEIIIELFFHCRS